MKKRLWAPVYGLAVAVFTVYVLLNTFVLRSEVQTNATQQNTAMFENLSASETVTNPMESGESGNETVENGTETDETDSNGQESGSKRPSHSGHGGPGRHHSGNGSSKSGNGTRSGSGKSDSNSQSGNGTASGGSSTSSAAEGTSTVIGSYEQDGKTITLTRYRENGTDIYVADVVLSTAQSLQTAFAEDSYGRNITQTTSAIAQAHNAILAINGDYYGAQETGYVIRNGVVYRDTASNKELLCIYADGTMEVVQPGAYTAQELVDKGVWQAFSFGPGIVENGSVSVTESEEVGKAMASNPRTAIGMISANHYVFVVSDGRTDASEGLSLYQLAQFMEKLGVTTAYNLDGGGSSTMYFNGSVVNNPTTNGRISERGVSDIVYIGA